MARALPAAGLASLILALPAAGLAVLALAASGCVDVQPGITGTTSLAVTITSPADLGSEEGRLPDDTRDVTIQVVAKDAQGAVDTTFTRTVDVYAHFLGTLTPEREGLSPPLTMQLTNGEGTTSLELPRAYGPTFLWVEDARQIEGQPAPTYATGTSPILWYREPFLDDVSRPVDETRFPAALANSPLEKKQVRIAASRHGASGHLVVTAVYAQGYTLSDVDCTGTPCTAGDYAHVFVFTFGRPRAQSGEAIEVGHLVSAVSGGVVEFNGFTELSFPLTVLPAGAPKDESKIQQPVVIDPMWLLSASGTNGMINLERVESGLVAAEGGTVCPLDDDYEQYGQWKLDLGSGCSKGINIITKGAISDFDPAAYVGQVIPSVVGTLRAVNIGSFNVWIVFPRRTSDLTLN